MLEGGEKGDRQTDRQTDRQADVQTHRPIVSGRDEKRERQTQRQLTVAQTESDTGTRSDTQKACQTKGQID